MPLPNQAKEFDLPFVVPAAATITAGFTVSFASPSRGEIVGIYLAPIDGTAITGTSGVLTLTVNNVAGATATLLPAVAGQASGGYGVLSARQAVSDGDVIKAVLAAGLTSAVNGVLTVIIRARSL
jgi:hypothetical protein